MPRMLPKFDPARDFEARTTFRAAGILYSKSMPFKKHSVSVRLLAQLYDQRKVFYSDAEPDYDGKAKKRSHKRMGGLLASFAASVLAHRRWDHHSDGATGTARKAPGAGGSPSATRGSASAPQTTETAAEGPVPVKEEAAAASEGDFETVAAGREARINELMIAHSQKQLVVMTKAIPQLDGQFSVSRSAKRDVAAALVDAE